jgi:hypothetical protein
LLRPGHKPLGHNLNSAGRDTVHLTNSTGCDSAGIVILTVNQLPALSWNPTVTTLDWCGSTSYLVLSGATPAGGSFSGQYVSGDTLYNNGVITNVQVTYTYTDAHSCSNTDSVRFTLDRCSDITETIPNGSIVIYPNPTENIINIEADGLTGAFTITISDITGRILVTDFENGNTIHKEMDISNFEKGIYLIAIHDAANRSFSKMVVKN